MSHLGHRIFPKFSAELFKFELAFRVRFTSFDLGLLHNLNTLMPFKILIYSYII